MAVDMQSPSLVDYSGVVCYYKTINHPCAEHEEIDSEEKHICDHDVPAFYQNLKRTKNDRKRRGPDSDSNSSKKSKFNPGTTNLTDSVYRAAINTISPQLLELSTKSDIHTKSSPNDALSQPTIKMPLNAFTSSSTSLSSARSSTTAPNNVPKPFSLVLKDGQLFASAADSTQSVSLLVKNGQPFLSSSPPNSQLKQSSVEKTTSTSRSQPFSNAPSTTTSNSVIKKAQTSKLPSSYLSSSAPDTLPHPPPLIKNGQSHTPKTTCKPSMGSTSSCDSKSTKLCVTNSVTRPVIVPQSFSLTEDLTQSTVEKTTIVASGVEPQSNMTEHVAPKSQDNLSLQPQLKGAEPTTLYPFKDIHGQHLKASPVRLPTTEQQLHDPTNTPLAISVGSNMASSPNPLPQMSTSSTVSQPLTLKNGHLRSSTGTKFQLYLVPTTQSSIPSATVAPTTTPSSVQDFTALSKTLDKTKATPKNGIYCSICGSISMGKDKFAQHICVGMSELSKQTLLLNNIPQEPTTDPDKETLSLPAAVPIKDPSPTRSKSPGSQSKNQTHHKCPLCPATFVRKYRLTIHIRTHTGEKPYKCKQCEKSFKDSDHLRRHARKHTGLKPFKCELCGKGFVDREHLKRHLNVHNSGGRIRSIVQ